MSANLRDHLTFGFTLIELMVAISILAVLSSIGLVFYSQSEIAARDSRRMGDLREIRNALEQHYALNRTYPGDINGSSPDETTGNGGLPAAFQAGVVPRDPRSNPYTYVHCDFPQKYIACAQPESCDGKCNRTSISGLNACTDSPSDGTSPTGFGGYYCVGSLSN